MDDTVSGWYQSRYCRQFAGDILHKLTHGAMKHCPELANQVLCMRDNIVDASVHLIRKTLKKL